MTAEKDTLPTSKDGRVQVKDTAVFVVESVWVTPPAQSSCGCESSASYAAEREPAGRTGWGPTGRTTLGYKTKPRKTCKEGRKG